MSKSSVSKIKLNSFQDLFQMNDSMTRVDDVRYIPLDELHEFRNHPFYVRNDDRMAELVESIKENGVLVPGIARIRAQGGYEIIAGHCRKYACEQVGLSVIPMYVRNVTDDEATILMVDSNIQRETILPSEKARSYKMKYDAIKHQGKRGDSLEAMKESTNESRSVIQRYIQLADLTDGLLYMLDERKLGFTQGVNISFLRTEEQEMVERVLQQLKRKISIRQSQMIKERKGHLTEAEILEICQMPVKKDDEKDFSISRDILNGYFDDNTSEEEIEKVILQLLDQWKAQKGGK